MITPRYRRLEDVSYFSVPCTYTDTWVVGCLSRRPMSFIELIAQRQAKEQLTAYWMGTFCHNLRSSLAYLLKEGLIEEVKS